MPGQIIQDNILLGQELLHSLKVKRGRKSLLTLKLDMKKAYDWMEWRFLLSVLRCFGFYERWVGWVEQCISTVSFSIMLNGSPQGFFKPSCGLHQGDPVSPFLFILRAEVLSRLFAQVESCGNMHGIKVARQAPTISHLLFADDLIVFVRANRREAEAIGYFIQIFLLVRPKS